MGVVYGETQVIGAFATALFAGVAIGASGVFLLRTDMKSVSRREGSAVVALGWAIVYPLFGSVPYMLAGSLGPVDAWFEHQRLHDHRCERRVGAGEPAARHPLLALHVAMARRDGLRRPVRGPLPAARRRRGEAVPRRGAGTGGRPPCIRISSSAGVLWLMYLLISVVLLSLFVLGGMDLFAAACSMFAVLGTGGFAISGAGAQIGDSTYLLWVHIVFMWICATSFSLHWAVITGKPGKLWRNSEWRFFSGTLAISTLLVCALLWATSDTSFTRALNDAAFMVVSTGTSTGAPLVDYERWVPAASSSCCSSCSWAAAPDPPPAA